MNFIDTHIHIDFPQFNQDREEVIKRAQKKEVYKMINIGCNLKSSQKSLELAEKYPQIWATVGVHPSDVNEYDLKTAEKVYQLAQKDKVVAIGEIGLDYFYGKNNIEQQKEALISQINIGKELEKPLIIHTRDAGDDLLQILKQENPKNVVIHCFTESLSFAKIILEMGYLISFTGIITYAKAEAIRRVVKETPLEKIMLETDCPFLAPQAHRGQRNEPAFVIEVGKKIAEIKEMPLEKVAEVTTKNAEKFFGI